MSLYKFHFIIISGFFSQHSHPSVNLCLRYHTHEYTIERKNTSFSLKYKENNQKKDVGPYQSYSIFYYFTLIRYNIHLNKIICPKSCPSSLTLSINLYFVSKL